MPVLLSSERRSIEHMNLAERLQVPLSSPSTEPVTFLPGSNMHRTDSLGRQICPNKS